MCGRPHFLLNRLSAHGVTWFLKVPPTVKTYSVFLKSVSGFLRATANDRIHPLEFCQRFSLTGISFVTSATALQWFCVFNFGLVWSYNYVCASHTDKLFYMLSAIPQLCLPINYSICSVRSHNYVCTSHTDKLFYTIS